MANEVFVSKMTLINLLETSAFPLAMFMASGTQQGTAMRILFENIDQLDLNCAFVQQQVIPMLMQASVISQTDVDRINSYITQVLS